MLFIFVPDLDDMPDTLIDPILQVQNKGTICSIPY